MKNQQAQKQQQVQHLSSKNRIRLMHQNKQLYTQIFLLDNKVNNLLSKKITNDFEQTQNDQKFVQKHKEQTKYQIMQIKKLKKKILLFKNSQKPQQKQDFRKVQDQVKYLQGQKQKYIKQKQALQRKRGLKSQGLQLNKPVQHQRDIILNSYKQTLRENNQLRSKIQKLQRQIGILHKHKQLSKTSVPKLIQNHAFQITKIQNQISNIKRQMKIIDDDWKPKIDSLTSEYFVLKDIKKDKDQQFDKIQQVFNSHKTRILVMKEQTKILDDKARISQIMISPEKRNQVIQKILNQQNQAKYFQNKRKGKQITPRKEQKKVNPQKNLKKSNSKQKQIQFYLTQLKTNNQQDGIRSQKAQNHNEFSQTDKLKQTVFSAKNEFSLKQQSSVKIKPSIENKVQQIKPKVNGIFSSVGVGTTFYYDDKLQNQ